MEVIGKVAFDSGEFSWTGGLRSLANRLRPEALSAVANGPQLFAFAEQTGYSPYGKHRVIGEKPAALRIVGQRNPEGAFRVAISRLRDPETPDNELYVSVVADLFPAKAASMLLDAVRLDLPTKVVYAIGRHLRHLIGAPVVLAWLAASSAEHRLAACRVAGFLVPTNELEGEIRKLVNDPENRVADAAKETAELLRRSRITDDLIVAFLSEADVVFRWTLLDGLLAIGDVGESELPTPWVIAIRDQLSPSMAKYVGEKLEKRPKKEKEELDRSDKR